MTFSNHRDLHAWGGEDRYAEYRHAPSHLLRAGACYFITAATLHHRPVMRREVRRQELLDALRFAAEKRGWLLLAWVVLPDHYHCILQAPDDASALAALLNSAHRFTATRWNAEDRREGRALWYQYRDTCLTSSGAFYARLNYIHHNPVKHGLCTDPAEYRFSSYAGWEASGDLADIETTYPWDRLDLG